MEKEKLISIVQAVQSGKEDAATVLYETFHNDIYYYILKTVKDSELAADLTQDTFIEILETIGKLQEPAAFVTWSRQIAYHRCTAHFRKRKDLIADENEDGYSIFDTMEEGRAAVKGCVDDTTRALLARPGNHIVVEIDGVICRARIDITITPKDEGTYLVSVYYG